MAQEKLTLYDIFLSLSNSYLIYYISN